MRHFKYGLRQGARRCPREAFQKKRRRYLIGGYRVSERVASWHKQLQISDCRSQNESRLILQSDFCNLKSSHLVLLHEVAKAAIGELEHLGGFGLDAAA